MLNLTPAARIGYIRFAVCLIAIFIIGILNYGEALSMEIVFPKKGRFEFSSQFVKIAYIAQEKHIDSFVKYRWSWPSTFKSQLKTILISFFKSGNMFSVVGRTTFKNEFLENRLSIWSNGARERSRLRHPHFCTYFRDFSFCPANIYNVEINGKKFINSSIGMDGN